METILPVVIVLNKDQESMRPSLEANLALPWPQMRVACAEVS